MDRNTLIQLKERLAFADGEIDRIIKETLDECNKHTCIKKEGGFWIVPRGKSQKTLMKDWMKITIEVHKCLDELEKLRNEKKRLLKLAEENPSMDVTKRMKVNLEQYEDLLNKTAELNAQAKLLKEKIGDAK